MFVGHLALALAGKSVNRSTSLGWYVAAVTTLDLLWPIFVLIGIEQVRILPGATRFTPLIFDSYPWSHSLVMAFGWGVGLALIARWRGVDRKAFPLIVVLVVSHWVLDFVAHAPDMPLWPGTSPRFGLGLWNSIPGTLIIEGLMWVLALALYLRKRQARGWGARAALWSLVGICTVMWASGPWGPLPPSASALAVFALIVWILPPWAVWVDRGYTLRTTAPR